MPADSAVTIFGLDHPRLARTLKVRLEKRRAELLMQLKGASDWPDFKERVGLIRGIEEAIAECDDIEKQERH